jgi:AcrR family transcriptional regulator
MAPSTTSGSVAPSRRARLRADTINEIKTLARRQLAEQGPGAISLRAIAREMGTAPSALFRYFPSHNDLISAIVVDAYNDVADALSSVRDAWPSGDHAGTWFAICQAYRSWSLENPSEFALLFGTPLPGYEAPQEVTGPAASRSIEVALGVYAAAVQAGSADPGRSQVPADLEIGALWKGLLQERGSLYEPRLAGIVLSAWAAVLGYLIAEIFGSLTSLIDDIDRLYVAHLRTAMLGMGFAADLVEAACVGRRSSPTDDIREASNQRPVDEPG